MKLIHKMSFLAIALALASCTGAWAQNPILTGFSGGSAFDVFYTASTGDVIGYRFTADAELTLTHLGILSSDADGVLDSSHEVGLWDANQALVTQVTVNPGDMILGAFTYAPITPVTLTAGARYTLGAMYAAGDADSYFSSPSSVSLDGISATNGVFPSAGNLNFVFPASDSTNLARIGPNAIYLVPEPGTCCLMGLGLFALLGVRRR